MIEKMQNLNEEIYKTQLKAMEIEKEIFDMNKKKRDIQEKMEIRKIQIQDNFLKEYKNGKIKTLKEVEFETKKQIKANLMPLEKEIENLDNQIFNLKTNLQLLKIKVEKLQKDFQIYNLMVTVNT